MINDGNQCEGDPLSIGKTSAKECYITKYCACASTKHGGGSHFEKAAQFVGQAGMIQTRNENGKCSNYIDIAKIHLKIVDVC